jgi:hypothetical protein
VPKVVVRQFLGRARLRPSVVPAFPAGTSPPQCSSKDCVFKG